ncbi:unnamed protein product, partial [Staurois parvus]
SLGHSGSPIPGKRRRCRLGHVSSGVQSQLITWDMYTDHQSTDDQCSLMICVVPAVPPVSVHQCQLSVLLHASCQFPSMPHISAHLSCLSVPVSATYQCCQSVPPISVSQCCLTVQVSAAYQCHILVLPFIVHQ